MALTLVICLLGLLGKPPATFVVGKLTVCSAALDGGLGWLVVAAAVNTVATTRSPVHGAELVTASDTSAGRDWLVVATASLASFLVLLDDSAVALALSTLSRELGMGLVELEWVVNPPWPSPCSR